MIKLSNNNYITECNDDIALQGLIIGDKAAIIIDAGSSIELATTFNDEIKDLIDGKKVSLVITHHHDDHVAGLPIYHVPIYLSEKTQNILNLPKVQTFKISKQIHLGDRTIIIFHVENPHTEDGTIIYDPKEKIAYIGDTIYAILKDGKASRNPEKALKLIVALSKLDAEYFVAFHNGVYEREPLFRYFNTVKLAIEISRKNSNWEVAKAYFEKKYQTATTDTLKRLYDSVLNV